MILRTTILLLLATTTAIAQGNADPLQPVTVSDLGAAEATAYFSLSKNAVVPENTVHADPASWDISFSGTSIAVNGSVRFVDVPFDELTEAPADGYQLQSGPGGTPLPGGSGTGWYDYDMNMHVITPVAGRSVVLKTKAGRYAKVAITSYYQGGMDGFGEPRYYTFRYALQPDGSRNLASTICDDDSLECRIEE